MNKIYKVIWSKVRNCYVAVSEIAKGHGKGGAVVDGAFVNYGAKAKRSRVIFALAVALWIAGGGVASAYPKLYIDVDAGGKVTAIDSDPVTTPTPAVGNTATEKTLTVKDGDWTIWNIYGGYSRLTDVTGYSLTLDGVKGTGLNAGGGYVDQANGKKAEYNTLTLKNSHTGDVYGGYSSGNNASDAVTGNVLNLSGANTVGGMVQNFETINFENVTWGKPALTLTGRGILQNQNNTYAAINTQNFSFSGAPATGTTTLIASKNILPELEVYTGATTKATITTAGVVVGSYKVTDGSDDKFYKGLNTVALANGKKDIVYTVGNHLSYTDKTAGAVTLYAQPSASDAEAGYNTVDRNYLYLADGFKSLTFAGGTWNTLAILCAGYSTESVNPGADLSGYSLSVTGSLTNEKWADFIGAYGNTPGTGIKTMSGNTVNISGGSITTTNRAIGLYGGYIVRGSWTTGDSSAADFAPTAVNISGGTLTASERIAIYGISNGSTNAAVSGGAVNITGGVFSSAANMNDAIQIGGIRNGASNSSGGAVSISGDWKNGAPTTQILATNRNIATIEIYAADTYNSSVEATGGSVTFSGDVGFFFESRENKVNLYGRGDQATGTGNTLHIGTDDHAWRGYTKDGGRWKLTNAVNSVNNFDTVALHKVEFPADPNTALPALKTATLSYHSGGSSNDLEKVTLDLTKLSFADADGNDYVPEADKSMTLLSSSTDLSGLKLAYDAATQTTPVALTMEGVTYASKELVDANDTTRFYSNENTAALTDTSKAVTYTAGPRHIALTDTQELSVTFSAQPTVSHTEGGYTVDGSKLYLADGFKSMTFADGTWDTLTYLYGGYATTGDVTGKTFSVTGGTFENQQVYGGCSESGKAENNTVEISGGAFGAMAGYHLTIYGGFGKNGVSGNNVTIGRGSFSEVFGGYARSGDADGNKVTISGGVVNHDAYGGYAKEGDAINNQVAVSDTGKVVQEIYGGSCGAGNATGNAVTVSGGEISASIYGGSSQGVANNNKVTISGGTLSGVSKIIGGKGDTEASGNVVTISGGKIYDDDIAISGGKGKEANDNTVEISVADFKAARICVGDGATSEGNKLVLGAKGVEVSHDGDAKGVGGIQTIALTDMVQFEDSTTVLKAEKFSKDNKTAAESANFDGTLDLSAAKGLQGAKASGTMTLLQSDTADNFTELSLKYKEAGDSEQTAKLSGETTSRIVREGAVQDDERANGVALSYANTHTVAIEDVGGKTKNAVNYTVANVVGSVDLAKWDSTKAAASVPEGWTANASGVTVETDGMTVPTLAAGTSKDILTANTANFFSDDKISDANKYKAYDFTPSTLNGVTLSGAQSKGVKTSDSGKKLVYAVGAMDVSTVTLGSVAWQKGATLFDGSSADYNYAGVTALGTKGFDVSYASPETVAAGDEMTLLQANATLTAIVNETKQSITFSYSPVEGVTVEHYITGKLTNSGNNVIFTPTANQADKLTFGSVDWKDSGALLTRPSNITFSGADVDTAAITFKNIQSLEANKKMTLVSDFGDSVGTVTGTKYKVGSGLEGEGKASLAGKDLIFTAETGTQVPTEATHETVMSMEAGTAVVAAGREFVDSAVEGLGMAGNMAPDGTSTFASMGGGANRYKTGSHVDTHTWNAVVAVGSKKETKKGSLEWGVFGEYGKGSYTLHDNKGGKGDGNTHYGGGGLLAKWTNKHDVYTEVSFRMGRMSDSASNMLADDLGNAYGYDVHANYYGAHVGLGKIFKVKGNRDLDVYGKFFYTKRDGVSFDAGGNHYKLDSVASSLLRVGARYGSNDRKWNWYGGLAYEYEFDGQSKGTVDGIAIRSASIRGSSVRGEIGIRMDATKSNPWKADISIYGYGGKHRGFGGNVSVAYMF